MKLSPLISQLIEAFRFLPGVGPKSAQRLVYHILERNQEAGKHLAHTLLKALENIQRCQTCRTFSETPSCEICSNPKRDPKQLCIVENPIDIFAIEQTASFSGRYFVLMGHLSPIDGIGPEKLGLHRLSPLCQSQEVEEVILAINPTVEGLATSHYIHQLLQPLRITVTKLAQGIPLGGELDYIDGNTLTHAFIARETLHET